MSIKLKKSHAALAAMVLALGAAVFINWYYTSPKAEKNIENVTTSAQGEKANLGDAELVNATPADSQSESFAKFTVERKEAHDKAKETLESVINNPQSSAQAVEQAAQGLKTLSGIIKKESDLETMITAKTGSDCIVIIDGESVKVITEKGTLTDNVTMQIKEMILDGEDFSPEHFSIFEVN